MIAVLTIIGYLIGFLLVFLLHRKDWSKGLFRVTRKTTWIVSGLSLLMFSYSATLGHFAYGIIQDTGIWGMWMVWVGLIGSGIVPFVFAPLWQSFNLETDNQFILVRFSGRGASILQIFRAILIGMIIVPMIVSMQLLAFAHILEAAAGLSGNLSILLSGAILAVFALKNTFQLKLAHDAYHFVLYVAGLIILFVSFLEISGGLEQSLAYFRTVRPEALALIPSADDQVFWNSFLVLFGIQWWSAQLTDGGGPEMARFTATKSRWDVVKAAALPVVLTIGIDLLFIAMILMSLASGGGQGEQGWVESVFRAVPSQSSPFILLVFFILFLTSAESFLNWGSSLLTVDVYKSRLNPELSIPGRNRVGIGLMVLMSIVSTVLALGSESIIFVVSLFLSISTGVAPVLLLRWFWMRINAWSQLSAMLASLVYTVLLYALEASGHPIYDWLPFKPHETRIVIVTVLTTLTWLTVTFLTPSTNPNLTAQFKEALPPRKRVLKDFGVALLFGLGITAVLFLGLMLLVGRG